MRVYKLEINGQLFVPVAQFSALEAKLVRLQAALREIAAGRASNPQRYAEVILKEGQNHESANTDLETNPGLH